MHHTCYSGLHFENSVYLGCKNYLVEFAIAQNFWIAQNISTKSDIHVIKNVTFNNVTYLMTGQEHGLINLFKRGSHIPYRNFSLGHSIIDIYKTSRPGEFAFATYNGLYFGEINEKLLFKFN